MSFLGRFRYAAEPFRGSQPQLAAPGMPAPAACDAACARDPTMSAVEAAQAGPDVSGTGRAQAVWLELSSSLMVIDVVTSDELMVTTG